MSTVKIDTNDPALLEKPKYELLEPGVYDFEVANKLAITKSNAGNSMIKVELACLADGHEGSKVFDNIVLIDAAKWKLAQFAKACGVDSVDGELDLDSFQGASCSAKIIQEPYKNAKGEDKLSNKVDEYLFEE